MTNRSWFLERRGSYSPYTNSPLKNVAARPQHGRHLAAADVEPVDIRHKGEAIGLYDTVVSADDYRRIFENQAEYG